MQLFCDNAELGCYLCNVKIHHQRYYAHVPYHYTSDFASYSRDVSRQSYGPCSFEVGMNVIAYLLLCIDRRKRPMDGKNHGRHVMLTVCFTDQCVRV